MLLALLVYKYLLYWYNSTNTDAEEALPREVVDLVMHAAQSLFPTIKQFTGLGLCRHWYNVGDTVFKEGDKVTDGLYILITGDACRMREREREREKERERERKRERERENREREREREREEREIERKRVYPDNR